MIEGQLEEHGIKTESPLKAIKMLRKYTAKEVLIKDLSDDSIFSSVVSYLGAAYNNDAEGHYFLFKFFSPRYL